MDTDRLCVRRNVMASKILSVSWQWTSGMTKCQYQCGCGVNSGCRVLLRIVADSDYEISGLDGRHDFQTYTTQAALWIHI